MKNLLLLCCIAAFFSACNSEKTETTEKVSEVKSTETVKAPEVKLAYTPSYSSSFEMGNPAYAAMILQGSWKDWEMNALGNMKSWIADTIVAFHADNKMIKGADSLIARWTRGRNLYSAVIDTVEAVIPVYSTDKKENWVLVWAKEITTSKDGKLDTVALMETWRINKDGKADMLLQFDRQTRKK